MDLNYTGDTTSGREGIDLLARVQAARSPAAGDRHDRLGSVDLAVEAMRRGVRDFVQKPWDNAAAARDAARGNRGGPARRQQRAAHEQRELDEARRIQRKLLPAAMPQIDGWELAASWQPAVRRRRRLLRRHPLRRGRLALTIADVVGKGIPAALLMSNLQAAVRAFATDAAQPAELCQQVNRILCGNIAEGRFISFFYCVARRDAGHADLHQRRPLPADAGARRRPRRAAPAGGPVLGVFPDGDVRAGTGRVGARRSARALHRRHHRGRATTRTSEFGEERLVALGVEHRACSAPALQARLTDAVGAFTGGHFQDDATLMVHGGGLKLPIARRDERPSFVGRIT